ncbi:hypothetical protein Tco_1267532 [Tanacetum coccineum]
MTSRPEIRKTVWGFGVRPDTLDPTLLNISIPFNGAGPWHVLVYTLSSNTWNSLENYRLPRVTIRIKRSWGEAVVVDIPNELRDELPNPFYIFHLGNSLVILENLILYENRYNCAWLLEVDGASVTSWRLLFIIPSPNVTKLIGFTRDDQPIVEVDIGRHMC